MNKTISFICSKKVAVPKELNIQRLYESNHDKMYDQYTKQLWTDKEIN